MGNDGPSLVAVGESSQVWQRVEAPASAAFYIMTSLAMTSITKYAASIWNFPGFSILLLVECVATVVLLAVQAPRGQRYNPFCVGILKHLPLVTFTKALNMYLSFVAMKRTNLPVYNVLKRLQPFYALMQDWLIRGTVVTGWEQAGVSMICLGTIVTGAGDLDFDLVGYGLALLASGCQSLYLVLARNAQDHVPGLTHVDLLFYTGFYNCFIFLPLSVIEAADVLEFLSRPGESTRLLFFLVPYVCLGAALNYTTFWCTAANSPLATAVAGTAKGVLSTTVGMISFGAQLTAVGWIGLVGSTAGGFVYSAARALSPPKKKQAGGWIGLVGSTAGGFVYSAARALSGPKKKQG